MYKIFRGIQCLVAWVSVTVVTPSFANSVIIDAASPWLVPSHFERLERGPSDSEQAYIFGSVGLGYSSNANLGTASSAYSVSGISFPVAEGLRAQPSRSQRWFLMGSRPVTSAPNLSIGGAMQLSQLSKTTDSRSGLAIVSGRQRYKNHWARWILGAYGSQSSDDSNIYARGVGLQTDSKLDARQKIYGSFFITDFQSDSEPLKGGKSFDAVLTFALIEDGSISPYASGIFQRYTSESAYHDFSAQGVAIGIRGRFDDIRILLFEEHKTLSFSAAFPLLNEYQDRDRLRRGLRLSLPTDKGLWSLEAIDDTFQSRFSLGPGDRREVRLTYALGLGS